jgi:short-subunit dehydrogenase
MLNPSHILITGASSGLGRALAEIYAAPGVWLSLQGRDSVRLNQVAASTRAKGAVVGVTVGDVTDAASMATWIARCEQQQPIDLVIANAGISGGTAGGGESDAQVRAIFDINLTGVMNTVQPVIPLLKKCGSGQIAIMSSLASFRGFAAAPAYCASKAAVRVYGEGLREELSRYGVSVSVICPGFIKTPMTDANRFPMPLIMSAKRAARIIKKGLGRKKARIAFPWLGYLMIRIVASLPQDWFAASLAKMPGKDGKG